MMFLISGLRPEKSPAASNHPPIAMKTNQVLAAAALLLISSSAQAQLGKIRLNDKAVSAVGSGVKAVTFSDADAAKLAREAVEVMDKENKVADANDAYAKRLEKIFGKHRNEDGLALNYKVYLVKDVNAFACADGSVRVFAGLMDKMTDEELLAVIGHEIGHVKNKDTRDAVREAYRRTAVSDAAASQSGTVSNLTEGQMGQFAHALIGSRYSRKQESAADRYSYDFLKKHKYNVMAEASAFRKLAEMGGGGQRSATEKMLSSHPESASRAADVEAWAKKDGLYKKA